MTEISLIDLVFVFLSFLIIYIYVGYPLILFLLVRLFSKPHQSDLEYEPSVSLVISAYNEEDVILEKLENALALNYPEDMLEIIVVSDGSTDRTDDIVKSFENPRIRLIRPPERKGKTAGLNVAMEKIHTEMVIFSDANAMYDRDAVRHLVKNFTDSNIGYVVGCARYLETKDSAAGKSEGGYWDYEVKLKEWESGFASVVGGDGAIYAIRRSLWQPLLETDINDFVNPLQIVAQGFRGVFERSAWCTELPAGDFTKEFERKKRIVNRSFNGLLRVPTVLNPFRVGRFAFLVISHKLLRWFSPFVILLHLCTVIVGALLLEGRDLLYIPFLFLYFLFFLFSLLGDYQEKSHRGHLPIFYFPYYLYLMNLSSALGLLLRFKGKKITKWKTVREGKTDQNMDLNISQIVNISLLNLSLVLLVIALLIQMTASNSVAYILLLLFLYPYLGYPAVLAFVALFKKTQLVSVEGYCPSLTLLIIAYNEEAIIADKLKNSLKLAYPKNKLKIIAVSDGSNDETGQIMESFVKDGIEVVLFPENHGKIAAINVVMSDIDSELVVLSDANVMYEQQALKKLSRHFADDTVGAVSGRVVLVNDGLSYETAENTYYGLEHFIQNLEGQTGSVIGADGAMYAIRKALFTPVPDDTILDDFVISMRIACQGMRLLHDQDAVGYEQNIAEIKSEYKRKRRIIAGGFQTLKKWQCVPEISSPYLLFKYLSHKLLRWLVGPLFVLIVLVLIMFQYLGFNDGLLSLCLFLIGFTAIISLIAHFSEKIRKTKVISVVYYQYMLLCASILGCYYGMTDRQKVTWKQFEDRGNRL